ncbi:MAG: NAD-dependent epimerase/dehydratase family protein [Caldilineaceae bacterium]
MPEKATQPKRVLVTGSTGAIGAPLCQHLVSRGHYVRGFARRPTPDLADYVEGDLNDRDKVRQAVEGMDTVVHLGAYPNPADFIDVLCSQSWSASITFAKLPPVWRAAAGVCAYAASRHRPRRDGDPAWRMARRRSSALSLRQSVGRADGRYVRPLPQHVCDQRAHWLAAPQPRRSQAAQRRHGLQRFRFSMTIPTASMTLSSIMASPPANR